MGVRQRRRIVGQAPEQHPEADVAPELAHTEEQCEGPVSDHANETGKATGKDLQRIVV